MTPIGQVERATQDRVLDLFIHTLKYTSLGNWQDRPDNRCIEESLLRPFLQQQGYSEALIHKALYEVNKVADDQNKSLYDTNKALYGLLRYGVRVSPEVGQNKQTVWLIDWERPENNHFGVAEEVSVQGVNNKRPDVVLYVNGIALGVLELKRSTVSVAEGIRQNLDNQQKKFIQPFFASVQLIMAGNDTEGLRYGVIETPEKYYLTWKDPQGAYSAIKNPLDRHLAQMCNQQRLLELLHDFIVYDAGVKKISRHNQYFGVKAAQERLQRREGGIIWHTQGSGKSLTMVWLARWIRENILDGRVLIITDRTELDDQIEKVFKGVSEDIRRCTSGADLVTKLNQAAPALLCALIHKFGGREDADVEGYMDELRRNLPPGFKPKGDLYIFVDECHRTQSGKLHEAMKVILPHAIFVGFTGTPLLKKDKQKSIEVFGGYIDTYKYDEAVADQVVLDLRYEARSIDQSITSQKKIDQWFDAKTQGLNNMARSQLKQRWGTMQKVFSSRSRLEKIVADILLDMELRDRLKNGRGNALLVAGSIYQACRLYELFIDSGFKKCAVITSYNPTAQSIKGEETGEGETERLEQYEIYQKMLDGKPVEVFEREIKEKFINEPGQMKLLIVVDKLLTGFDAPPATYLYIDKKMQDHGLFQAICRVNRLDGEDKEYGYIIDYKDLFNSLENSIKEYTSGALDNYDKDDVAGLLKDRLAKACERLDELRERIKALCDPVAPPKGTPAFIRYFCGSDVSDPEQVKTYEQKRLALYKLTVALLRAYAAIANEMEAAGYTSSQTKKIKEEVEYYEKARTEIKLASGDHIDLKLYEPHMRHLIDHYLQAGESEVVSAFDDLTLVELIVQRGPQAVESLPKGIRSQPAAVAETIENNLRKLITDERPLNPKYYDRMSEILAELIKKRRAEALVYEQYLEKIVELIRRIKSTTGGVTYPARINNHARRALYDNLGQDEALAVVLDEDICSTKKDGWRGHKIKEREVRYAISEHIPEEDVERIFEIVKKQPEY
jgi:type I restriction enzyme, R subunit